MVPSVGFEPTCSFEPPALNRCCLPIPRTRAFLYSKMAQAERIELPTSAFELRRPIHWTKPALNVFC